MKNMMKVITTISVLSLVLITVGVTLAFYSYTRTGTTENKITSGVITFHYQEGNRSISVNEAVPMSDTNGKGQNQYFDFVITSDTIEDVEIPYVVTARMSKNSTLDPNAVKIWISDQFDTEIVEPKVYGTLPQYSEMDINKYVEKVIYTGKVTESQQNYSKNFRVRIWIDDSIDFSSGNYDEKTFTLTFNVYSRGTGVTTPTTITYYDFDRSDTYHEWSCSPSSGCEFCLPGVGQQQIEDILSFYDPQNYNSLADAASNYDCTNYNSTTDSLEEYVSPTTPPANHTVYVAADENDISVCIQKNNQTTCAKAFDAQSNYDTPIPSGCFSIYLDENGVSDTTVCGNYPFVTWWNDNALTLHNVFPTSECQHLGQYSVNVWQCESTDYGCYYQTNGSIVCKNFNTNERCQAWYSNGNPNYYCEYLDSGW